jgi:membrane dipeptidase
MEDKNSLRIIDLHADLPYDIVKRRARGEQGVLESFHLRKLREGRVTGLVAPIWVESPYKPDQALGRGLEIVDALINDLKESPSFRLATSLHQYLDEESSGKISLFLGVEGGELIGNDLELLRDYWRFGVRCFGLVWNERNLMADGMDHAQDDRGLTDFGKQVIEQLNELGIVIDLAHMAAKSFWDVLGTTKQPVIVSHTATPRHRALRNLDDDQLQAIASNKGMIGIFALDTGAMPDLESYCDHIEYAVKMAGPEHVGLGPDFVDYFLKDLGADPRTNVRPVDGLEDHRKLPAVASELASRGLSNEEISMIMRDNYLRVFKQVVG